MKEQLVIPGLTQGQKDQTADLRTLALWEILLHLEEQIGCFSPFQNAALFVFCFYERVKLKK